MTTGKPPVLLVDDEPEILFSLRGLLRNEFDVLTAENGAQALETLGQRPVHVLMTDQRMPQMTGVELLREVQTNWPDVVRIVFTGYADINAVIDAINEGHVYRYVTKPWDPDELLKVLREASELYQQIVERRELLSHLDDYVGKSLELLQEPSAGPRPRLVQTGTDLRAWLDRVLGARRPRA
jgi:DNA-binding NtrC family response regulator